MFTFFKPFIEGLKKSFNFNREFTRTLSNCKICGEKAFTYGLCQICQVELDFKQSFKDDENV